MTDQKRNRAIVVALLAVLLLGSGLVYREAASSRAWMEFSVPDTDLIVEMPGVPSRVLEERNTIVGKLANWRWESYSHGGAFTIGWSELPPALARIAPLSLVVREGKRQAVNELSAEVRGSEKVEKNWGGMPGRRYDLDIPPQDGRPAMDGAVMVLFDGSKVFIVSVVLPLDVDFELSDRFFHSVSFGDPAPGV